MGLLDLSEIIIFVTPQEAIDFGCWSELCKLKGFGKNWVNAGIMRPDYRISITYSEYMELFK